MTRSLQRPVADAPFARLDAGEIVWAQKEMADALGSLAEVIVCPSLLL